MKRFTGDYEASDGRRICFFVDAEDFAAAELAVEQIGSTARIDGELIEEGDGWPPQVGRA